MQRAFEQFFGFFNFFAGNDLCKAQIKFCKVVIAYLRQQRGFGGLFLGFNLRFCLRVRVLRFGLCLRLLLRCLLWLRKQCLKLFKLLFDIDSREERLSLFNDRAFGQLSEFRSGIELLKRFVRNAELFKNLRRGAGQERTQANGDNAQALRKVIKHGSEPVALCFIFCQQPRCGNVDIFVAKTNKSENLCQGLIGVQRIHAGIDFFRKRGCCGNDG